VPATKKKKKKPKQSTQSISVSCCVPRLFVFFPLPLLYEHWLTLGKSPRLIS